MRSHLYRNERPFIVYQRLREASTLSSRIYELSPPVGSSHHDGDEQRKSANAEAFP